tara:strand:+ start:794 stop:973 length:180 start_codon:yes stop_codon:yes gene_type:complete
MIKTPDLKKYLDKRKIEIEKKTILKILNKENTPLVKKKKLKDIFIMGKCPKGNKICKCK